MKWWNTWPVQGSFWYALVFGVALVVVVGGGRWLLDQRGKRRR